MTMFRALKNAVSKGKKLGKKKTRNSTLIQNLLGKNMSQREVAKLVGCSKSTVQREQLEMRQVQNENQGPDTKQVFENQFQIKNVTNDTI